MAFIYVKVLLIFRRCRKSSCELLASGFRLLAAGCWLLAAGFIIDSVNKNYLIYYSQNTLFYFFLASSFNMSFLIRELKGFTKNQ
jgi:hypothetical protein